MQHERTGALLADVGLSLGVVVQAVDDYDSSANRSIDARFNDGDVEGMITSAVMPSLNAR